jgi:hypothetical protein
MERVTTSGFGKELEPIPLTPSSTKAGDGVREVRIKDIEY